MESYYLTKIYYFHFDVKKRHIYKPLNYDLTPLNNCWKLITLQSPIKDWPQNLNTNMVIDHCTHIIQTWMIHHFDQRVTADAKIYHTWLYDKCTIIYDHIRTPFWRSVSASGHGNLILNKLPRPTRVRSRPPQWPSLIGWNCSEGTATIIWTMQ